MAFLPGSNGPPMGGDLGGPMPGGGPNDEAEQLYQQAIAIASDEQLLDWAIGQLQQLKNGRQAALGGGPSEPDWMGAANYLGSPEGGLGGPLG